MEVAELLNSRDIARGEVLMARLTSEKRKNLRKSEFAIPGELSYPIPDKSHARNALARVSQFGSPSEKAEVRAKVHAKYPEIGRYRSGDRK